jgi:hypothetical protein
VRISFVRAPVPADLRACPSRRASPCCRASSRHHSVPRRQRRGRALPVIGLGPVFRGARLRGARGLGRSILPAPRLPAGRLLIGKLIGELKLPHALLEPPGEAVQVPDRVGDPLPPAAGWELPGPLSLPSARSFPAPGSAPDRRRSCPDSRSQTPSARAPTGPECRTAVVPARPVRR